jgi:Uma2 family endonuclease
MESGQVTKDPQSEEVKLTTALSSGYPRGGLTIDDLDAMPEDGRRRELIDGVLIASTPTHIHEKVVVRLVVALEESCPAEYEVTPGVWIGVDKHNFYVPDVMVITAEAAARGPQNVFPPGEVVLALEVVSPSSTRMDRIRKPGLYASAGIPFFWRVETKGGLIVHTHQLTPQGFYQKTGEFGEVIDIDEPWPIKIPIAQLTPRFL